MARTKKMKNVKETTGREGEREAVNGEAAQTIKETLGAAPGENRFTDQEVRDPTPGSERTEQSAEQNGKEPLPPPAATGSTVDQGDASKPTGQQTTPAEAAPIPDDEDEEEQQVDEEDEQEAEPGFTEEDRKDLPILEKEVEASGIQQARALREIRQRKLWMLHRRYKTFDEYCDDQGFTRQWVTQQTRWLAAEEKLAELRARGVEVPNHLSAHAVSGLYHLAAAGGYQGSTEEDQEEQGLVAVLQEAQEEGLSFGRDNLRLICDRRARFFQARKQGHHVPAAPTYPDYRQDVAALQPLKEVRRDCSNWNQAQWRAERENILLEEALIQVCKETLALPDDPALLAYATGAALEKVVGLLLPLAQGFLVLEDQQKDAETARRQAKKSNEKLAQLREGLGIPAKPKKPSAKRAGPAVEQGEDEGQEASATEAQEDGGATTALYDVDLSGGFAEHAEHMTLSAEELADLLREMADSLVGGWALTRPSSLTVRPQSA